MHADAEACSPDEQLEVEIAHVWKQALAAETVPLDRGFMDLGGDSLAAVLIAQELETRFAIAITPGDVYANPTVRHLAEFVRESVEDR